MRAAARAALHDWIRRLDLHADTVSRHVAGIDDPGEATKALIYALRRETRNAVLHGAHGVAQAAGAGGIAVRPLDGIDVPGLPPQLASSVKRAWEAASHHPNPMAARQASVRGMVLRPLASAHQFGASQQVKAAPQIIGWRRIADPGACSVCLTLDDGTIHSDSAVFRTHPGCRCGAEPVLAGVNTAPPPGTGHDRILRMTPGQQDRLLGPEKAQLLRDGWIEPGDLIIRRPRRPGLDIVEETTLQHARLIATRRNLTDRGLISPGDTDIPPKLTPEEAHSWLLDRLRGLAEASWDADSETYSWAIDAHYGYMVTMPDRAFDKIGRDHQEVPLDALRRTILSVVQKPDYSAPDKGSRQRRRYYGGALRVLVEFSYNLLHGEAFNAFPDPKPPRT